MVHTAISKFRTPVAQPITPWKCRSCSGPTVLRASRLGSTRRRRPLASGRAPLPPSLPPPPSVRRCRRCLHLAARAKPRVTLGVLAPCAASPAGRVERTGAGCPVCCAPIAAAVASCLRSRTPVSLLTRAASRRRRAGKTTGWNVLDLEANVAGAAGNASAAYFAAGYLEAALTCDAIGLCGGSPSSPTRSLPSPPSCFPARRPVTLRLCPAAGGAARRGASADSAATTTTATRTPP